MTKKTGNRGEAAAAGTVLMLSWEYPPRLVGGISRHVQELSRALCSQGHSVHVVTAPHPDAPAFEDDEGVSVHRADVDLDQSDFVGWVHRLNAASVSAARPILQRAAETGKPVIIHAHDWLAAFAAKELKLSLKLPMVATIHATEFGRHNGLHSDVSRYISGVEWELAFEAWKVIACSHYMRDQINYCFATPFEKMVVVPNGIDPSKFDRTFDKAAFRSAYAAPDEKMLFFVGRMVREKGAQVLLEAFAKVLSQYDAAKLVIAGGGYRDHLVEQAAALGISDRVYFTGYIDDETLIRLYLSADIAVFPSLYEPFGIVALEAMAAKVPVVVSDAGGLREVVSHGVTGISTWANNADSLAWGILQVLRDEEGARLMAQNAWHSATTEFSWERIARRTADCYADVWREYLASGWGREGEDES